MAEYHIDAKHKRLGRLATEIAGILNGKKNANYEQNHVSDDKVYVKNVAQIEVTGNKLIQKVYYRHTGYPGGIYETNFLKLQQRHPQRVLQKAVRGMLPKGPLGYAMLSKLKVYGGATHSHSAQQPKPIDLLKA